MAYGSLGQHQRQLDYLLKCEKITTQSLGEEHPEYAKTLNNIGMTYGCLGQH